MGSVGAVGGSTIKCSRLVLGARHIHFTAHCRVNVNMNTGDTV
jgi:hypothetical protein